MRLIRAFEECALALVKSGEIVGGIHPYIGEEAVAVGVCAALRADDLITSTHRGHGHVLAKGADPQPDAGRAVRPGDRPQPRPRRLDARGRRQRGHPRRERDRRRRRADRRRRGLGREASRDRTGWSPPSSATAR